jgi:hypothetical protein
LPIRLVSERHYPAKKRPLVWAGRRGDSGPSLIARATAEQDPDGR